MKISISILCDCGNEVLAFKACAWTDYAISDWRTNIKCSKCQEQEMEKQLQNEKLQV